MVLRRPYAFLIKHFRLIHLIIAAIFAYLVFRNRSIYSFLNTVIAASTNRYGAAEYVSYGLFAIGALALALCVIVFLLLKYKDKPRRAYIFIMVGYGIIGVFMLLLFGYMSKMTTNVVDAKTIRLYRDIMMITLVFQYIIVLFMAIRGLGFDIKKFDFNKDAQELNILESDSEEVEVNTQIDTTNIARGIKKQQREFGYYYKEFRIYIIIILAVVGVILLVKGYKFYTTKYKVYHEDDYVGSTNIVKVVDSYYSIKDNKNYVIVSFDVYKYGKSEHFNINNMALHIGRKKYLPDKTICSKFSNLGNCYKKQYVNSDEKTYILVYEVDKLNIKRANIVYSDSYKESYKIKLSLKET